jgi:membrane-associated phospholipid phosphatase
MVVTTAGSALAQAAPDPVNSPAAAAEGEEGAGSAAAPAPPATPPPPAAPVFTDRPFSQLFPNLLTDFKRYPSIDTLVVLGIGGTLSAVAAKNDDHLTEHASAGGTDDIFAVGGGFGDGFLQAGIAIGTYAVGRLNGQPRTAHVGADLIRAQLFTGIVTHALKAIVQRERPTTESGTESESSGDTYAFPSGHAAASWTTATVLWRHLGWKVGVPASILAGYTSAARLQQNQHYMSDVIFGAALGVATGRTVTIGHGDRKVAIVPTVTRGGAALMFALVP